MTRLKYLVVFIVFLIFGYIGYYFYSNYFSEGDAAYYETELDHFLYGSIGAEVNGYPYNIWKILPFLFEDKIPDGYKEFGFIMNQGKDLPVGLSVRKYGIERIGFNCATCHTSIINKKLLVGAPSLDLDIQKYLQFLEVSAMDSRFTSDNIFKEFEGHNIHINSFDKLVYRWYIIPKLKSALTERISNYKWEKLLALHGPGRTDAINPWKYRFGILEGVDSLKNAVVSFPSVWNQEQRKIGWMHWDGNNKSVDERNISAALAGGASEKSVDIESIKRVALWLDTLQGPKYPYYLSKSDISKGEIIFNSQCSICHNYNGKYYGESTSIYIVQTDPGRWEAFNNSLLEKFYTVGQGYDWQFRNYRKSEGYSNQLLDGIWARFPYLHNNSVPTLFDLLTSPSGRPTEFYVGCGTFDTVRIGTNCSEGFLFDTHILGNSNLGHNYGTTLSKKDILSLIEYLKSL